MTTAVRVRIPQQERSLVAAFESFIELYTVNPGYRSIRAGSLTRLENDAIERLSR